VRGEFSKFGVVVSRASVSALTSISGGREIEWKGVKRVGFSTEVKLKRSDFNFDPKAIGPIGDEALIIIDCEGMKPPMPATK
jgi:polyisoprenoid-binding protein YceI